MTWSLPVVLYLEQCLQKDRNWMTTTLVPSASVRQVTWKTWTSNCGSWEFFPKRSITRWLLHSTRWLRSIILQILQPTIIRLLWRPWRKLPAVMDWNVFFMRNHLPASMVPVNMTTGLSLPIPVLTYWTRVLLHMTTNSSFCSYLPSLKRLMKMLPCFVCLHPTLEMTTVLVQTRHLRQSSLFSLANSLRIS